MDERAYEVHRKTNEVEISLLLNLDGTGRRNIRTGIGFLDHMLEIFTEFSLFDIELTAKGDLKVDDHHLTEEVGIILGEAVARACGGDIVRFGDSKVPLDEALCEFVLDISGRPYFFLHGGEKIKEIQYLNTLHLFFDGVSRGGRFTSHCTIYHGLNSHHIVEASFKAAALAFHKATRKRAVGRTSSTKGYLI